VPHSKWPMESIGLSGSGSAGVDLSEGDDAVAGVLADQSHRPALVFWSYLITIAPSFRQRKVRIEIMFTCEAVAVSAGTGTGCGG
jgi:hypothetical protein